MSELDKKAIVLGGRVFHPAARSTIQHDHWMMSRLRKSGVVDVHREEGEEAKNYALRVLDRLLESQHTLELMGGVLVPAEATGPWTPDMAVETALFIGGLDEPEDKATARTVLVSLLIPFFTRELSSSTSTARPSDAAPEGLPSGAPGLAHRSESGAESSGFSPGRT